MIRTYSELVRFQTFEERYKYLALKGGVGNETFGFDRYLNQEFYKSREWRDIRNFVISRDKGCDLGCDGYEIHSNLVIHHMNPMTVQHILHSDDMILDPDNLITTTHNTHNAIHYGDERLLSRFPIERATGDTKLW